MSKDYISKLKETLDKTKISNATLSMPYDTAINAITDILFLAKKEKKKVFFCGNGGSAGIAIHMTADFLKIGGLNTQCLFNQATLTCICNDLCYEYVFSKQLELMAEEDDLLISISSSGQSQNIIRAIHTMRNLNGKVITFTGFEENNPIRSLGDYNIYVPLSHYGIVESIHNIILQQLVDEIVEKDGIALKIDD